MLKKEKHLGEILGAFLIKPKERSRKKLNKVYRYWWQWLMNEP